MFRPLWAIFRSDGPQWPKHVVSIINRIQDSCVLTYPTPSLFTYNTTGMLQLKKNMDTIVITVFICSHLILKVFIVCAPLSILKFRLHMFEPKNQVLTSCIGRCSAPNSPQSVHNTVLYRTRCPLFDISGLTQKPFFFRPCCTQRLLCQNHAEPGRYSSGIHSDSDRVYWRKGTPWIQRPLYSPQNK